MQDTNSQGCEGAAPQSTIVPKGVDCYCACAASRLEAAASKSDHYTAGRKTGF